MHQETDYTRLLIAVFLAALLLIGWQAKVEWPRRQALAAMQQEQARKNAVAQDRQAKEIAAQTVNSAEAPDLSHEDRIAASPRLKVSNGKLDGSISLRGARFDDLQLSRYRVELEPTSPEVTLLTPQGERDAYFAQAGWVATDGKTKVPDAKSLWKSDKQSLTPGQTATLRWDNGAGVTFVLAISMDEDYMFSIAQSVENRSKDEIAVAPYAYINRAYDEPAQHFAIQHEGPLGVAGKALKEVPYKDLRDNGNQEFKDGNGWFGIGDKYWLTALVPGQESYKSTFNYYKKDGRDRYQVDYIGTAEKISPGSTMNSSLRLFAGAKEIKVLDRYEQGGNGLPPIALFDRAVDFGVLYLLTKPLFLMLNFFYSHIGNFGIAIMMLTIVVKLAMFPLANKAFKSTAQMRDLQPEMMKIKERHGDDKQKLNAEILAMYKREKVNPASGCMPVLLQMPVFFALYKVLFVTIEMRHAPFFGWIRDLSAPDSSNLFTLFGTIPWNAPHWMHLGVLPMLMCVTMIIQMKQQPKPADPVQAKMMMIMPFFFLFMFNSFPAGLVMYWVWSNTLSILQQAAISWHYHNINPVGKARAAKLAAQKEAEAAKEGA